MNVEQIEIEVERIIDLRWKVLRAGLPRASAMFEGDDAAHHFAAVDGETVLACLSMMRQPFNNESAWQLRGMACAEACRGQGIGRQLLEKMEATLLAARSEKEAWLLWCNAREAAVDFYKKCGWQIESEAFDIPGAGVHFQMSKRGPQ